MEKNNNQEMQAQSHEGLILSDNSVDISIEIREQITKKIEELRQKTGTKRIHAIVVKGDEFDNKPLYIGYFKRPNMLSLSLWMNMVQKDTIQANRTIAQNCFVDGDKELVDDEDLFLYGTQQKISTLMEGRNAELVKLSSAGK